MNTGAYSTRLSFLVLIFTLSFLIFLPADLLHAQEFVSAEDRADSIRSSRKPIDSLSQEEVWARYENNPCYLPLINDPAMWEKGKNKGFHYKDLFNEVLPGGNAYRNRYIVGDFNVIDRYGRNRGIHEIYPRLSLLREFQDVPDDLLIRMDTTHFGSPEYDSLLQELRVRMPEKAPVLINFLTKVWNYKMLPVDREFSIYGNLMFAAGQSIVMCEACGDTLIMIGRFATSAKRIDFWTDKDSVTGKETDHYYEYLPIGNRRRYYAGLNTIQARHWEYGRKYDSLDIVRDKELGGGDQHVVIFRELVQLPNFLSILPAKGWSTARLGNGLHEVSPIDGARGMLGTANSLGCLRLTDFASKFLRWWVPNDCKFFIAYNDTCYHKKIPYDGSIEDFLPFKSEEEGNAFRKWINTYQPFYARILEVDEEGDFRNGYIIDAYYHLKDEYDNRPASQ